MKVKTLSALAGLGGALIMSGEANAAYTGLSVVLHTTVTVGGTSRDVYRVYANFTNADDRVINVFGNTPGGGNPPNPLTIENRNATDTGAGTGFFNGAVDTPPPSTTSTPTPGPTALWATFMTVGVWISGTGAGAPLGQGEAPVIPPGQPSFIAGASLTSNNFAWTITPDDPWGRAGYTGDLDPALRVGIMQLTVNAGQHVRGTVNMQIQLASALAGEPTAIFGQTFNSIPAPGALALLGVAGLIGSRRRRA